MDKRFDHTKTQHDCIKKWLAELTYQAPNDKRPLFSIDTPPPTVSGSLHIGHIFSYIQTDIIARYQRMQNQRVFYPFGFDDNGLPTERFVEKKYGVRPHEIGRSKFIQLCLEESTRIAQEFKELWQKIGLSADWQYTYSTISPSVRKISQESFIRLYQAHHIYRAHEPALYCTTCQTSVAQAELDDVEKSTLFNTILFKTDDGISLPIATTRPELLGSCVAVFYHPDDKRYAHLKGQNVHVPIFNYTVPFLSDEHVKIDKGTGLVMCCTFGDKTDVLWYKKYKLPYRPSLNFYGKFKELSGPLAGKKIAEARETIIQLLKAEHALTHQEPITHTVNVHERCKKEIEYLALEQWFLRILDKKNTFIAKGNAIDWYPDFMKSRYIDWVENISWDWCLSRQRFYGIPFPAWHCAQCKKVLLASSDQLPIDPQETPYQGACPECGSHDIVADKDVMDTWNTSSLTPYICLSLYQQSDEKIFDSSHSSFLPMSLRPQAHDIIRTWAFDTIVKSALHSKNIPWENIVISGHVLAGTREKLSKSKDNTKTDPQTLLETYPADAIRYWTASATLGHDVMFSDTQLKQGNRLITKLWNAFIFIEQHLHVRQIPKDFDMVNSWIINQAEECFSRYEKELNSFEFSGALQALDTFFWQDFCDNYLEFIKHRLFNPDQYNETLILQTQWTLWYVGFRILQMYASYLPFVTETLYQQLYLKTILMPSLHQTVFHTIKKPSIMLNTSNQMQVIQAVVNEIRKIKTENQLSLRTDLQKIILHAPPSFQTIIIQEEQLIKGITQARELLIKDYQDLLPTIERDGEHITARISIKE